MFLGLDLGTTNVKAVVVDTEGRVVAEGSAGVERYYTPDGGVEQDLEQIWDATCSAIRQAIADRDPLEIAAIGVSSQGAAMQVLDAEDRPIGRVISWLDGRGRPFDQEITAEFGEDFFVEHVGRRSSTMTIGQIMRLSEKAPADLLLKKRRIAYVGDCIVGRLCGHRAHDATSLSIAGLLNPSLGHADHHVLGLLMGREIGLAIRRLLDSRLVRVEPGLLELLGDVDWGLAFQGLFPSKLVDADLFELHLLFEELFVAIGALAQSPSKPDVPKLSELFELANGWGNVLPDLLPATTSAGRLLSEAAHLTGLTPGKPVSPAVHDQYAASLGAGSVQVGDVSLGTGTAWAMVANTHALAPPVTAGAFVCPHPVQGIFGQMLSMVNGGSSLDWALKLVGRDQPGSPSIDDTLEAVPPGSDGLRFWPLLSPSGAPGPFGSPGGRIAGVTLAHTADHVIRAVVEGLACELARHLNILTDAGLPVRRLVMCGGAAASRVTPQIVADVTGRPVACVTESAVSALGAAIIARAMVEPQQNLAELAWTLAPTTRTVEPGDARPVYRELLEAYLEPFSQEGGSAEE